MEKTSLVYNKNGTLHIVSADLSPSLSSAVILVISFLLGVSYNLIVTTAILSNKRLRRSPFHEVLVLICTTCLLDCLMTESLAFGFVLGSRTDFCRTSAVVFLIFLFAHSASLSLLCLERTFTLREQPVAVKVCMAGALSIWILGLLLVSPLFSTLDIHYFPNRKTCGPVTKDLSFPLLTIFAFLLTWSIQTVCVFMCVLSVQKYLDNQKQITILSIFSKSNEESLHSVTPLVNNGKNKISLMILFLQVLLLLPLTISLMVNHFQDPMFEPDPWIDPRLGDDTIRVVVTNDLESLFVYCRYMYNALVPIIVLSSDGDVRLQSRLVFCCKRNVIAVSSDVPTEHYSSEPQTLSSVNTPILFATSKGIHLRVSRRSHPTEQIMEKTLTFEVSFCDLTDTFNVDQATFTQEMNDAATASHRDDLVAAEDENPANKKNVRFSSKVDAFSPLPNTDWNASKELGHSHTHVIESPLFVKGENKLS
ncbi:uncharacterized protein LOC124354629 [Homalodisca vitripennis]|uniref:uncharacterized protein LOC124354629 n=1 Tax=Homalodisca vitripennis TaxID=197043 RepID=UPI001EEC6370|nr:uncharacterized protein LOC124354629 [Homalodisca vitripennis]